MPRSLNYLCISLFTESQITCLGWINVYILFVLLAYLYIYLYCENSQCLQTDD